MSKPKLTPWIDGDIKPTIPGVYERKHGSVSLYSSWTGTHWLSDCMSAFSAVVQSGYSHCQSRFWRGLASDPSKGAK